MRLLRILPVVALSVFLVGCPFIPPEPPAEAILAGDWTGTTEDNVALVVTFDANGELVKVVGTVEGENPVTINVSGSTTTLDGDDVTVTIPGGGDITATYDATLSADRNTMTGTVSREVVVGGGNLTVTIIGGDLTLTREVEPECETDADCAEGEACTDGECVAAAGCETDADCAEGEACTDGECVTAPIIGDEVAGETYYTANGCGNCHGADAQGPPSLVGKTAAEIFAKLSGAVSHGGDTFDGVTEQDAADLEAYIASIQ